MTFCHSCQNTLFLSKVCQRFSRTCHKCLPKIFQGRHVKKSAYTDRYRSSLEISFFRETQVHFVSANLTKHQNVAYVRIFFSKNQGGTSVCLKCASTHNVLHCQCTEFLVNFFNRNINDWPRPVAELWSSEVDRKTLVYLLIFFVTSKEPRNIYLCKNVNFYWYIWFHLVHSDHELETMGSCCSSMRHWRRGIFLYMKISSKLLSRLIYSHQ